MFCSFSSDLIHTEIKCVECLCEKVDLCLLCWRKIRLTVLFRSAAEKCSAPLSPIWFHPRQSSVSVCVKKSIYVFCVEEEKTSLIVLFCCEHLKCHKWEDHWNVVSLKENQRTDFDSADNYSPNENKAAAATLYTCCSSSVRRRMCKYFCSMSKIDAFQLFFTRSFTESVLEKENLSMETRRWRNIREGSKKFSISKWSFQLLKRNDLLAKSWICSLSNRWNSF